MNASCCDRAADRIQRLYRKTCQIDFCLAQTYSASLCLSLTFLLLPSPLCRIGAGIVVVALAHMICQVRAAHAARERFPCSPSRPQPQADLVRLHARIALARSALFNLPFLAGVNLVFMGLPVGPDPLHEAGLDCVFLATTIVLFSASFLTNQIVLRTRFRLDPLQ